MWNRLRAWLDDPPLSNPIERQQAPLIQLMLIGLIALALLGMPLVLLNDSTTSSNKLVNLAVMTLSMLTNIVGLALIRRGRFALAITLIASSLLVATSALLIPRGLNTSWITLLLTTFPIAFAGLLARRRLLWTMVGLSILSITTLGALGRFRPELVGYDAPGAMFTPVVPISFALMMTIFALGFDRFGSALSEALERSLDRERELEQTRGQQEATIAVRTGELRAALREVEQREAHMAQVLADLRASQEAVRELSAPVIPVLTGVLVAPLVGELDEARTQALTSNLLGAVERERARYIIFDITGVPIVDTHVAQVLLRTASAIRLLGAQVLLVGVRPEVAQTMVALGIELSAVTTYADLREAVVALLLRDGWLRAASV